MPSHTIKLDDEKYKKHISSMHKNNTWSLCVGAGICRDILPDWFELTRRIVNKTFDYSWDDKAFKKNSETVGFSLDAWIQGSLNHHVNIKKETKESFNKILENELYRDLLDKASEYKLNLQIKILFEKPKSLKRKDMLGMCHFFEKEYGSTTLVQLVKVLVKDPESTKLPQSIITLNADSLLYSLLIIFSIRQHNIDKKTFEIPEEKYRKITKPYQTWGNNIPVFHLHGSISPSIDNKILDSRDNLIFLEDSYNQVAGSMHSWAQSTFLYTAQNNMVIFLGLSMSDSNLRRWLGWTASNHSLELNKNTTNTVIALRHLWIKTEQKDEEVQKFLDVSLHHLGVKIALIKSWSKIGESLSHILKY